ncbi:MAG: DUF131 domain-containing protein [Candidatus Bathyarchaeia archaeon]
MFTSNEQADDKSDGVTVSSRLFGLLLLGFGLVFVGVIVLVVAAVLSSGGSGSVGGVIFIGPIPIVFGAGPDSNWLIIISIIIAVVMFAVFFIFSRRTRRVNN